MDVPVAFDLKLLAAYDTLAFLLQPKFQPPLVPARLLYHLTLGAFFKVEFPRRVIRIGCPFDLDVSPDRCLVRLKPLPEATLPTGRGTDSELRVVLKEPHPIEINN